MQKLENQEFGCGQIFNENKKMPLKIIKLLMTHPKIDRFEAEFAITVTDQKRKISDL